MADSIENIIHRHSSPLEPLPTGEVPVTKRLAGIRAVLFDVYGTMFISGSGEVGTVDADGHAAAFCDAMQAVGISLGCSGTEGVSRLQGGISDSHEVSRRDGIAFPEVDIVDVWTKVLVSLAQDDFVGSGSPDMTTLRELAIQYEVRANPAWPMPGVHECLAGLQNAGVLLGIISNAQFFTPSLFPSLLSEDADALGFHSQLQFYSYRYGQAKPGRFLYELAAEELATLGVKPAETLFVGNDLLNDVKAAAAAGFRTALFAGDVRSLRWRTGDDRVENVAADIVLTHLEQLPGCVIAPLSP
ncbi:MAG: HAD hydrolase-like protein [Planctomycetaceae bacterium]|jgi:putative hydrolase of the HAD superfamily|nr:HAD hydrolase-like protein [Planctomycetaceae bacterium]MBT6484687.1 HAD hydrolase-like protein [Planctomycetaceae bacterium]MBT6493532.1 HAD hydrolase-like protein [Planctomycetaceae bacterium]